MTPWAVACQKYSLFMEFCTQEYWSGLPFPFPGDRLDPGIEPRSPTLQADALTSEPPGQTPMLLIGFNKMVVKHQQKLPIYF